MRDDLVNADGELDALSQNGGAVLLGEGCLKQVCGILELKEVLAS